MHDIERYQLRSCVFLRFVTERYSRTSPNSGNYLGARRLNAETQLNVEVYHHPFFEPLFQHHNAMPLYQNYQEIEVRIQECIVGFNNGEFLTMAPAARHYNVPYDRLRRRVHGNNSISTRPSTNQRLNAAQEAALKPYIDRCDRLKMYALVPQVVSAAQSIVNAEHPTGKAPLLSKKWATRWLAGNLDCRRRRQRP